MSVVSFVSGEWMISSGERPNGGDIIVYRSAWVTFLTMLFAEVIWNYLKPCQVCTFQLSILQTDLIALAPWAGAVFGGAYLAFYARFSSQWTYLANLYNLIKEAEVGEVNNEAALAEWKAGFIEDALELHLASKRNFAGIIRNWSFSDDVREVFLKYTPNGQQRWDHVLQITKNALSK